MTDISYSRSQFSASAHAGTHINTVGTNRSSALTTSPVADGDGKYWQYIGFYDGTSTVCLGKRQLKPTLGSWTIVQGPDGASAVGDAHNAISVGVDPDGCVHIVWGLQHSASMNYWRGTTPGDISFLPDPTLDACPGGDRSVPPASDATYAQFFNDPTDGTLYCGYRYGSSGSGDDVWCVYDENTTTWTTVQYPLFDGAGTTALYHNHTNFDANGRLHHGGCIRDSTNIGDNHDWLYYYSDDGGANWKDVEGNAITIPVTSAGKNAVLAWTIGLNDSLMNTQGMTVWSPTSGVYYPVMGGYWDVNANGISQYSLVWWDGTDWRRSQIGTETGVYQVEDDGTTDLTYLSQPDLRWKNGKLYMFFRSRTRGFGKIYVHATPDFGRTVETHEITMNTGEMLIPMLDDNAWALFKELYIYDQEVYIDSPPTVDTAASILALTPLPDATYTGTISTYLKNAILNHFRGISTYSRPATLYLAAFNNGTELSGNGYARVAVTNNATNFPAATARRKVLAVEQLFPQASATWTVTEIRLMDASSNGNTLFSCSVSASVAAAFALRVRRNDLAISFTDSGGLSDYIVHELLDHVFGGANFTTPATTYGAYFSGDPRNSGTQLGSRVSMANDNTQWSTSTSGRSANLVAVSLTGQPTASCFAEYDASSNGNLLSVFNVSGSQTLGSFAIGGLSVAVDNA